MNGLNGVFFFIHGGWTWIDKTIIYLYIINNNINNIINKEAYSLGQ